MLYKDLVLLITLFLLGVLLGALTQMRIVSTPKQQEPTINSCRVIYVNSCTMENGI